MSWPGVARNGIVGAGGTFGGARFWLLSKYGSWIRWFQASQTTITSVHTCLSLASALAVLPAR